MSTIFDNHGSIAVSSNQIAHKDQEKLSHRTRKRIREAKKKARPGKLNMKLKVPPWSRGNKTLCKVSQSIFAHF